MKQLLLVLLLLLGSQWSRAQIDTLFWFAVPHVAASADLRDRPIYLRLTSHNQPTVIHVRLPAVGWFTSIVRTIPANSTISLDLTPFIDSLQNRIPNQVSNWGLYVWATSPINAYYEIGGENCECNAELFSLKGKNGLGTAFRIPMQNLWRPVYDVHPTARSAFDIVATTDNTIVTITPSVNVIGHNAGIPFSVVLNEGQTYSVQADTSASGQSPAGSYVSSNQPIAITMKEDAISALGGCVDMIGDQILPISQLGDGHILTRGALARSSEPVVITTISPNTSLYVGGSTTPLVTLPQAGSTYILELDSPSLLLASSAPIYVVHITGDGCELSAAQIPPLYCTGSPKIGFIRSTADSLALHLVVPAGGEAGFLVNGMPGQIPLSQFQTVGGTNGSWKSAVVNMPLAQIPVGSTTLISNSTHVFQLGLRHGQQGKRSRYAYFSNYNTFTAGAQANSPVCLGDSLVLRSDFHPQASYLWQGPGGFRSTQQNPVRTGFNLSMAGTYYLYKTVPGCSILVDSVLILSGSSSPQPVILADSVGKCYNQPVRLFANRVPGILYQWTRNGQPIPGAVDTQYLATQPGSYKVRLSGGSCVQDSSNICVVYQFPLPAASLNVSGTQRLCLNDTLWLSCPDSSLSALQWFSNGQPTAITDCQFPVTLAGLYKLQFTDRYGCISFSDSVNVVIDTMPEIRLILHPDADLCTDSVFTLLIEPVPVSTVIWYRNGQAVGSSIGAAMLVNQPGNYQIRATFQQGACLKTLSSYELPVYFRPLHASFSLERSGNYIFDTLSLTNTSVGGTQLTWDTNGVYFGNAPQETLIFGTRGTHHIRLSVYDSLTGCSDDYEKWVYVDEKLRLIIPTAFSPNGDGLNDELQFVAQGVDFMELKIYNRWGQLVFQNGASNYFWDGTNQGEPCAAGNYLFVLSCRSKTDALKAIRREIMLIR